jgi:hypothetical protein
MILGQNIVDDLSDAGLKDIASFWNSWAMDFEGTQDFLIQVNPNASPALLAEVQAVLDAHIPESWFKNGKRSLYEYYDAYVHSQFDAGGFTFSADRNQTQNYQTINFFVAETPGTVNYFIIDVKDVPHAIASKNQWDVFWAAYKDLFTTARDIGLVAWTDIQATTNQAEVDAIMDALPPIPGQ